MIRNNFIVNASISSIVFASALLLSTPARAAEQALSFAVSGVVEKVLVKPGASVRAGVPLARLDTRPFKSRKRAADARASLANDTFKQAEKNLSLVQQLYDDLATSGEALEKAKMELSQARTDREIAVAHGELAAWQLEQATLKAPSNGTVTQVPGYRGLVVHPQAGNFPIVMFAGK